MGAESGFRGFSESSLGDKPQIRRLARIDQGGWSVGRMAGGENLRFTPRNEEMLLHGACQVERVDLRSF